MAEAAELEHQALAGTSARQPRTWGILAVSAVALSYQAARYQESAVERRVVRRVIMVALLIGVGLGMGAGPGGGALTRGGPAPSGAPAPSPTPSSAGSWLTLAPLQEPRQELAVATLNGEVYAIGGLRADQSTAPTVEVYDPTTNRWRFAAPLPAGVHHPMAAVVGGKLYVLGGLTGLGFAPLSTTYAYDPATNAWSTRAPVPTARGAGGAAVVGDRIYLAGGYPGSRARDFAVYDPAADVWTPLPPLPTGRDHLAVAAVGSVIYAVGGRPGNLSVLEAFDTTTGQWSTRAPLPTGRSGIAGAVVGGCLHVFGGEGNAAHPQGIFNQHEVYDPAANSWRSLPPMPNPRHGIGASAVGARLHLPGGGPVQGFGVTAVHDAFAATLTCGASGGHGLTLRVGPPTLSWRTGTLQTGYLVARWTPDLPLAILPPDGTPLPAPATSYVDPTPPKAGLVCYLLVPLGPAGALGLSDFLCHLPGSGAGAGRPGAFAVRLDQSPAATLTWAPPADPEPTGYQLIAVTFDGQPPRLTPLDGAVTTTVEATGGQPTCYVLQAQVGASITGTTDALCPIPGVATFDAARALQRSWGGGRPPVQ